MGTGLQIWDAAGHLIFDTPDRCGRIVGTTTTTANTSGSVNFTVPTGCTPYWFSSAPPSVYGTPNVSFTVSGTTVTLSWVGGGATTLFYGYY